MLTSVYNFDSLTIFFLFRTTSVYLIEYFVFPHIIQIFLVAKNSIENVSLLPTSKAICIFYDFVSESHSNETAGFYRPTSSRGDSQTASKKTFYMNVKYTNIKSLIPSCKYCDL